MSDDVFNFNIEVHNHHYHWDNDDDDDPGGDVGPHGTPQPGTFTVDTSQDPQGGAAVVDKGDPQVDQEINDLAGAAVRCVVPGCNHQVRLRWSMCDMHWLLLPQSWRGELAQLMQRASAAAQSGYSPPDAILRRIRDLTSRCVHHVQQLATKSEQN